LLKNLKNKKILIISPNFWGNNHVTKHHYASYLSKKNEVWFLEPPLKLNRNNFEILLIDNNIKIIKHKYLFPGRIKNFSRFLYYSLMKYHVKYLIKKINIKFDIIIDFSCDLDYANSLVNYFDAKIIVLFPVDPVTSYYAKYSNKIATHYISITKEILKKIDMKNINHIAIGHAISNQYKILASKNYKKNMNQNKPLSVGYIGSLIRDQIDTKNFMKVIKKNKDLKFHLWGGYDSTDPLSIGYNSIISAKTLDFISFLKKSENVILYGSTPKNKIIENIDLIDLFFICNDVSAYPEDIVNSHKVLEYLAHGKAIVSHHMIDYVNTDVINMPKNADNSEYLNVFHNAIKSIQDLNSEDMIKKRKKIALNNLYTDKISIIDQFL